MTDYNNMEEQYQFTNESIQMMQECEMNDFAEYDQAMYNNLYYYNDGINTDDSYFNGMEEVNEQEIDDTMMWENNEEYDQNEQEEEEGHDDEALLRLIVGVQMYISESTTLSKNDSPLLDLQYKMYTYMKQKAVELGVDTSNLY